MGGTTVGSTLSLVAIFICMFVHACGGQRCLPLFFPTPTSLLTDSASLVGQQAPGILLSPFAPEQGGQRNTNPLHFYMDAEEPNFIFIFMLAKQALQ